MTVNALRNLVQCKCKFLPQGEHQGLSGQKRSAGIGQTMLSQLRKSFGTDFREIPQEFVHIFLKCVRILIFSYMVGSVAILFCCTVPRSVMSD